MKYQQLIKQNMDGTNGGIANVILRLSDHAYIPFAPDNTDYQEYLKFLAEGGQPLPADDNGQTAE